MVFSSFVFILIFLPLTMTGHALCPARFRNLFLFLASLFFYAWGEPLYVPLLLLSITVNYFFGLAAERARALRGGGFPTLLLAISLLFNLSLLCFFKYTDFLIEILDTAFGFRLAQPHIPLPIGISFYTFQAMSYVIDVCRDLVPAQRRFVSFGCYVSMFPQLIAGPIVQYKTIAAELSPQKDTTQKKLPFSGRRVSSEDYSEGIWRFSVGMAKKVILANSLGTLFDEISATPGSLSLAGAWLGALAFTLQIYFDFSGYSDMAIGLGRMLGFHFLENFEHPYASKSITEFWRRWHISLGTWFREYVYIPLGGNRRGLVRQCIHILVVWLLTGLWHGASANFVMWGLYYAILLAAEKLILGRLLARCPSWLRSLYTMGLVITGWVIFALPDASLRIPYLKAMLGIGVPLSTASAGYYARSRGLMLLIGMIGSIPLPGYIQPAARSSARLCALVLLWLLSIAFLVAESYNPFLYFRF